ncbi:MAG: ComEC/Rec2 family competence protein [Luteibaculaceae bacterium]
MDFFLNENPFIRVTPIFGFGILFQIFLGVSIWLSAAIFIVCLCLIYLENKFPRVHLRLRLDGFMSFIIILMFFSFGCFVTNLNTYSLRSNSVERIIQQNNPSYFYAKLKETPVLKAKSIKIEVDFIAYEIDSALISDNILGKANIYLELDTLSRNLVFGDIIRIPNQLRKVEGPKNPEEFNYARYLSFHNIYHQGYYKSSEWLYVGNSISWFNLRQNIHKLRNYLLSLFDKYEFEKDEKAVASALILGYKHFIDYELSQSYSSTGAMHVLAVSGLHVGIVYAGIVWLLSFLGHKGIPRFLKAFIALLGLWFYAGLTGMSPSVQRAAAMFSFMIVGKYFFKSVSTYNSIFASAFFLLVIDPYIITQVGFQLSYLAVLGIIYFQPKIYKLLFFKNKILNQVWNITAVSIAAQLATFPLGLLYFHQFPTYFFISNLIVIPGAFVVLVTGIVMLIFTPFELIQYYIAVVLEYEIKLLNFCIKKLELLPFALIESINITIFETYWIYFIVVLLGYLFVAKNKDKVMLWFSCVTSLLFAYQLTVKYQNYKSSFLNVYDIRFSTAVEVIRHRSSVIVASQNLIDDFAKYRFHMSNYHAKVDIVDKLWIPKDSLLSPTYFTDLSTFVLVGVLPYRMGIVEHIPIELRSRFKYLVFCDRWVNEKKFREDLDSIKPLMVVIPTGVGDKQKKIITEILDSLQIEFVDVSDTGFFQLKV